MVRMLLVVMCFFSIQTGFADKPPGFLWYNLPPPKAVVKQIKPRGVPFSQLSFQQKDLVMAYYTREAWHKAMNERTVGNMRNYIALQDFWSERATHTSRLFEKTMLYYPQYHYETTHPSSNLGVKVSDERQNLREALAIQALAKTHGLLYFYRGKNPYDAKENPIILDFSKRFGLHVTPVSVDGVSDPLFPTSQMDRGQADQLKIRFFPALILVNPNTQKIQPVSYGLVTQDMLARQFLLVATDFAKGDL